MKSMKGRLLKTLKSIQPIGYLKQDRVLQVFAADGFVDFYAKRTNPAPQPQPQLIYKEPVQEAENQHNCVTLQQPEVIDVTELMRDLEAEGEEEEKAICLDDYSDNKENIGPLLKTKGSISCNENAKNLMKSDVGNCRSNPLSEIDVSSFRRPDLNSSSLFDPNLLAAFEQAVKVAISVTEAEKRAGIEQETIESSREEEAEREAKLEEQNLEEYLEQESPYKTRRLGDDDDEHEHLNPLLAFEEMCPPGGDGSVILYSTTLRGIRKTFEDCNSIRFLLESFRVLFYERDVSMHKEYKEELWRTMGGKAVPPRLFIMGRYIGGAQEVLGLHEQGKLRVLFEGAQVDRSSGPCESCAGVRFVLCYNCSGSHKVIADDGLSCTCSECNENGLIICPSCC